MNDVKKVVAIEDLAHDLGLLDSDVEKWVKEERIEVSSDYRGRPSVDIATVSVFSQRQDYPSALKRSIAGDEQLRREATIHASELLRKRMSLVKRYQTFVDELGDMHQLHMQEANRHSEESGVRAAYLLFIKAINCLRMGCDNLKAGYWFAGSIMREIDETIDLAQYFIIATATDQGKIDLSKWYRQNRAPKHSKCREALAQHVSSVVSGIENDNHRLLMNELYQKKSKWVHPTFGAIREVTEFSVNDSIQIKRMPYGKIDNELKLYELTEFYKSSIWSAIQAFMICFSQLLPLQEQTKNRLVEIDREFGAW